MELKCKPLVDFWFCTSSKTKSKTKSQTSKQISAKGFFHRPSQVPQMSVGETGTLLLCT